MRTKTLYAGCTSATLALVFIALMFVPTSDVAIQDAEFNLDSNDHEDGHDVILTREEWNEWYRNADSDELGSYHNVIIRDAWVAQYDFEQEFHPADGYVVEYLSALIVQKEMLQGMHDNEDDERLIRYHEWLLEKFDVPSTIDDIDHELIELVDNSTSDLHRIYHVHHHNLRTIMIAEPPFDLWWSDPDWWWLQNNLSACQYEEEFDCEVFLQAIEDNRPLTKEELERELPLLEEAERQWDASKESQHDSNNTASDQSSGFLPKAHASYRVDKYHTLNLRVSASDCDAQHCIFRVMTSGTWMNNVFQPSQTRHVSGDSSVGYSAWASASNSGHAISQAVTLSGKIDQPRTLCKKNDVGTTMAVISCSTNPPGRDHVFRASIMSRAHAYYD